MKKILVLLLSSATIGNAALIQFGISPSGTNADTGLSPANEVPAVTNSTGSGGLISGGVVFDAATFTLQVAIGYGSAAGFTDLSGQATGMTLNGPAATNQTAAVLVDLSPYHFPAINPTRGGIIFGNLAFPTNAAADLLAGLVYVNLQTDLDPAGEIRGQLVPVTPENRPPTVSCPGAVTVECGSPTEVTALVGDPDGDALTAVWTLNGVAVQTNAVAAGSPPTAANVSFVGVLPLGTNTIAITVTDTATNSASCSTAVTVVDTIPPVIQAASANPDSLWPPNHGMVSVKLNARVTDVCGPTTWKVIGITSNEPQNGRGDGNTASDWTITGDHTVRLRAERSGTGQGRFYTITIQATDQAGNLSEPADITVTVAKSQRRSD